MCRHVNAGEHVHHQHCGVSRNPRRLQDLLRSKPALSSPCPSPCPPTAPLCVRPVIPSPDDGDAQLTQLPTEATEVCSSCLWWSGRHDGVSLGSSRGPVEWASRRALSETCRSSLWPRLSVIGEVSSQAYTPCSEEKAKLELMIALRSL